MVTGPFKGKSFYGSIIRPIMMNMVAQDNQPSSTFSQSYSGFYNLNNCYHSKVTGVAIATPVPPSKTTTINSLFGEVTSLGNGLEVNILTQSTTELYQCCPGNFNYCQEGNWYFGVGLKVLGDTTIAAFGDADLKGSYRYIGRYRIEAVQVQQISTSTFRRRSYSYSVAPMFRTSDISPTAAIHAYQELVLIKLEGVAWKTFSCEKYCMKGVMQPLPLPTWTSFSPDVVFPVIDRNPNWGILADQAYKSVPFFGSNGIALGKDLLSLKKDLGATQNLISILIKKGVGLQVVAKIFLAFHYGWKLLFSDLSDLSGAIDDVNGLKSSHQKCSAHTTWGSHGATYIAYYHCYYDRYGNLSNPLDQLISEFDLELNLGNIWDLIPFSFVVDWFTHIGSLLESIDSYYQMTQEHEIVCSGRSVKCRKSMSTVHAGLHGWLGTIDATYYIRQYSGDHIPPQYSFSTPTLLDHTVEGAALIVSRR